jgi:stress response protein YsnF
MQVPHPTGPARQDLGDEVVAVRSEERLQTGVANVVVGRARLITSVVTEERTITVPLRRQEIRLVHDKIPAHEQHRTATAPTEQSCEVVRYEERVVVTTEIVPVERVRMVRRVRTAEHTVDDEVRAERIDTDRVPDVKPQARGDTSWD